MRKTFSLMLILGFILASVRPGGSAPDKSLLEELNLPLPPGAKLLHEANFTAGEILDEIKGYFGPLLGLSDVKRVTNASFAIQPQSPEAVLKFYEPSMTEQEWKTAYRDLERDEVTAIFVNEKKGMLYIEFETDKGELTIMRVFGNIDPSKVVRPGQKLPEGVPTPGGPSRIPIGQPISVPPSERLHLRCAGSDIRAYIYDRNTAEIRLATRVSDPGELQRIDERLVLSLTPRLRVEEINLPGAVPLLLELTEGSLSLFSGPGGPPQRINIIATGAPITLDSFPLLSGTHTIRSIGGEVYVLFSTVQGGVFDVEVTGKNLTTALPRNSSARLDVAAPSGKVENLTGLQPSESAADRLKLQMGAGKAEIVLRAINGTVCIKFAD